jgi:hypothetical protein
MPVNRPELWGKHRGIWKLLDSGIFVSVFLAHVLSRAYEIPHGGPNEEELWETARSRQSGRKPAIEIFVVKNIGAQVRSVR